MSSHPPETHGSAAAAHEDHIHMPPNTFWPILAVGGITCVMFGSVLTIWGGPGGLGILLFGVVGALVSAMGWFNLLVKERSTGPMPNLMKGDLGKGVKLFLISEAAIFGAFFAHYYYTRGYAKVWPPEGSPHLHTYMPAIATLLLMTSSVTCEIGHHMLLAGRKGLCKDWLVLTLILGLVFLGMQGYEWGYLWTGANFTMKSGIWGTLFYLTTGFHALHVATGLVLLVLVYGRLELGHFSNKEHFAMNAASWYWHFVDVIWIFLFFSVYLMN